MAIQCTNCGTTLPRDDARFCTNCGTLVPSHPFSPRSSSSTKSSSTPLNGPDQPKGKPVLREQHAQQTPARPLGRSFTEAPSSRMSRPESRQSDRSFSEGKKEQQGGKSPTVTDDPDQNQLTELEQKARQALGNQNQAPSAFGDIQQQLPEGSIKKPRLSRGVQPPPENRQAADLPTIQQPVPEKRQAADLPTIQQPVPELRTKVWEPGEQRAQIRPSMPPISGTQSSAVKSGDAVSKEPIFGPVAPAITSEDGRPGLKNSASPKSITPDLSRDEIAQQDTSLLSSAEDDIAKQNTSGLSKSQDEIAERDTAAQHVSGVEKTEKEGRNPRDFFDGPAGKDEIPDLPTSPILVAPPATPALDLVNSEAAKAKVPEVVRASTPAPVQERNRSLSIRGREQPQPSAPPETPQDWQQARPTPAQDRSSNRQPTPLPETSNDWQQSPPLTPSPNWQPQPSTPAPARGGRIDTSKMAAIAAGALKRRPKRWPLFVGAALLIIILVVGWLVITNPFTIAPITQPNTTFTNSNLKVSLAYPTDWKAKVNSTNTSVHLYDSTNTGQATLSMAGGGQDLTQYLKKQANQLGMTGVTDASPVTFGGTTWQQVKGSIQESGASYTGTMLATEHQGQIYTLLQLAPQATYTQEDQVIFSPIRSSFKFIG